MKVFLKTSSNDMLDKQAAYRRKIKKELYFAGSLSCSDLSMLTGKSLPLTIKVLNELLEEGKVIETGYAVSTGGRRPQIYALKPELMYTVSVAMDQLITRIALMDMQNHFVGEVEQIELPLTNNPKALEQLTSHIERFIKKSGVSKNKIVGIGIGMPGFVDVNKGINHSFLKPKQGYSIISYIQSIIHLPVVIDNDSSLIALAELRLGSARHKKNVMVINIGWGIGLGVIVNGELFRGANGFAGEFSHIPLFTNNKLCSCGKTGCLETETSLLVIAEKAIEGLKKGKISILKNLSLEDVEQTYKTIMDAASRGDKFAVELLSEAGYNIGRGVAILIHLANPELVILSGRGSAAGKIWLAPIQQAINEHCIPMIAENTEVQISQLGYQAELIGAAALVMEHYDTLEFTQHKNRKTKQTA
ncbi:MAG TPA: ROK family protein [Flavisolibacter sp.]|nr:ROK family protein [Flavisolibacter sp.]